jgi:hypothetical protein
VTWTANTTPASTTTGSIINAQLSFTNQSSFTWQAGGSTPVRLAYHWKSGACPGATTVLWDGRRTNLPGNVAVGSSVTNLAVSLAAPATAGTYCLIYDLVEEGVTWFSYQGALTSQKTVQVDTAPYVVSMTAHSTPNVAFANAMVPATLSFKNDGSSAWPAGGANPVYVSYHWKAGACPGRTDAVWDGLRTPLAGVVAPGQSVNAMPLTVRAPASLGTYCLVYDLVREGMFWFSWYSPPGLKATVNIVDGEHAVSWGAHTTPATITPGATVNPSISFTNVGNAAWPAGGSNPVKLSYHWRSGACPGSTVVLWDAPRTSLPGNVAAGQTVSNLQTSVTAPATAGVYCLSYDLVHEGVTWFSWIGAPTLSVSVGVGVALPTPTATAPAPTSTATPAPSATPAATPVSGQWAFQETFDGTPANPQNFSSPRWDISIGGSDAGVLAGHGATCGAPPATHAISGAADSMFNCNNHMMTTADAGYTVLDFTPRQPFDWQGRTGVIEFEVGAYGWARNWWDIYISPPDENLLDVQHNDEGGSGELYPKRAVLFSFLNSKPEVRLIDNYETVYHFKHWQQYCSAVEDDPACADTAKRKQFRISLSATNWKWEIQKPDGTWFTLQGTFPQPVSFSRGLLHFEHHAYNPVKDGVPVLSRTFHWDNIRFDGPMIPPRQAFEAANRIDSAADVLSVTFNGLPAGQGHLLGQLSTQMLWSPSESNITNSSHWAQLRVNGGPWQDVVFRKPVLTGLSTRGASTIDNLLTFQAGTNVVEFKFTRPSNVAPGNTSDVIITDLEVQYGAAQAVGQPVPFEAANTSLANAFVCAADENDVQVASAATDWSGLQERPPALLTAWTRLGEALRRQLLASIEPPALQRTKASLRLLYRPPAALAPWRDG